MEVSDFFAASMSPNKYDVDTGTHGLCSSSETHIPDTSTSPNLENINFRFAEGFVVCVATVCGREGDEGMEVAGVAVSVISSMMDSKPGTRRFCREKRDRGDDSKRL